MARKRGKKKARPVKKKARAPQPSAPSSAQGGELSPSAHAGRKSGRGQETPAPRAAGAVRGALDALQNRLLWIALAMAVVYTVVLSYFSIIQHEALRTQMADLGNAMQAIWSATQGDLLMILDGDLTVAPTELPKFFEALVSGRGELAVGSRLVYPMAPDAMRPLNLLGNRFFGVVLSFLMQQRVEDTLCGTKALFASDYRKIAEARASLGSLDPFGDFDLLFGASRLNLRIVDVAIRYHERTYGETNISRFRHGWLLLQMSAFAARKLKFL